MTFFKELLGHVFSSLLRNKLRSFLTMAGIAWGVASIVLIVAMGDGFREGQRDQYRQIGEKNWHEGTTQNISRSGMLFKAEELLQPNAVLEINLVLPAEIAGLSPTEVVCRGEVVRTVKPAGETIPPALAARILQYHFQHGARVPRA